MVSCRATHLRAEAGSLGVTPQVRSLDGPSGPTSVGTAFHRIAAEHGVSPQQIALAWLLTRSPAMIPVPGASRPASLHDSAQAAELTLSSAEPAQLDDALPG
ncbi:aldo/keto reductase [Streptomyces sp. NPDC101393]|uniref:aldo/keto reductase n=1 Tax=Streptomyces sp. NPDC101393 TaxID=3366141 RepID=UPI00381A3F0A